MNRLALAGLTADAVDQQYNGCIVHFCCHYYTKEQQELDQSAPFLSFDDLRKNISISLFGGALASVLTARREDRRARYEQALVVLNACATAASAPFTDGILQTLLSHGFCHIVASETLVPDSLSSAFAVQFYFALMRGESIGEALLSARLGLLNLNNNPGGLLYTLYGDPNMRLALNVERRAV